MYEHKYVSPASVSVQMTCICIDCKNRLHFRRFDARYDGLPHVRRLERRSRFVSPANRSSPLEDHVAQFAQDEES
jgi:hypothetical protein